MTIKMISRGGHRYQNRMMTGGEEFEVPGQSMRRLMRALKWADDKPAEKPAEKPTVALATKPGGSAEDTDQGSDDASAGYAWSRRTAAKKVAAKKTTKRDDE